MNDLSWPKIIETTRSYTAERLSQLICDVLHFGFEKSVPNFKPNSEKTMWSKELLDTISKKKQIFSELSKAKKSGLPETVISLLTHDFKKYSSLAQKLTRRDVRRHEARFAKRENVREFYKFINSKLSVKAHIPPLKDTSGNLLESDYSKCNMLNQYFSSVFTHDDGNVPLMPKNDNIKNSISTVIFTKENVLAKLKSLNNKTSVGPDGIPNIILKRCAGGAM